MEMSDASIRLSDIGERLKAFRMGRGLSPEELAETLRISRAALYRAEKGHIPKIETLARISEVLQVSLPTLLGVGIEYVDTAVAFFERMRQLEEQCHQIVGLFGPISYLLTSESYDETLRAVLLESTPQAADGTGDGVRSVETLMDILAARKASYLRRRPLIASLVSSSDIERFLLHGLVGRHDLPAEVVLERRHMARAEAFHILDLLYRPPIGVQVAIVHETIPATSFQIFRQNDRSVLAISPFRLGEQPNVRVGAALITSAPEALSLHESIAQKLWDRALRGPDGAQYLAALIERYAIAP
jgi:transcriptional regulator with XRE-family HTH domain